MDFNEFLFSVLTSSALFEATVTDYLQITVDLCSCTQEPRCFFNLKFNTWWSSPKSHPRQG